MRKVTRNAIDALYALREFHSGNTAVLVDEEDLSATLYLHGNPIADYYRVGQLFITHAGWPTATTKERLNGLPGVSIHQKDFQWYLNGELWDGTWTEIC